MFKNQIWFFTLKINQRALYEIQETGGHLLCVISLTPQNAHWGLAIPVGSRAALELIQGEWSRCRGKGRRVTSHHTHIAADNFTFKSVWSPGVKQLLFHRSFWKTEPPKSSKAKHLDAIHYAMSTVLGVFAAFSPGIAGQGCFLYVQVCLKIFWKIHSIWFLM
jgi:hypothetical protein